MARACLSHVASSTYHKQPQADSQAHGDLHAYDILIGWQVENEADSGPTLWALVKGAPEVLQPFLQDAPADYEQAYKRYASQGARYLLTNLL